MTDATASPDRREYYPLRPQDLVAIGVFWLFLAFLSAASRELDPRIPGLPPRLVEGVLRAEYLEYALWALFTVPIWWFATRYSVEGGRRYGRIALFLVGGIVLAIFMDNVLTHLREAMSARAGGGRFRRRPPPGFPGFGFVDDLLVYFAVLGSGVARDYFLRYRTRLHEAARLRAQLVEARLDALRAQLNPHFLFNTLNAVAALVERDPRGVRRMIARLSDLLRYTLDESTEQEVPLEREVDLLGEYVELMQIRFQDRLQVEIHVDDDVRRALVPNLILQPILENAIKHGVSQMAGVGRVEVRASRSLADVVVTITDNGPGPGAAPPADSGGVGLRNVNARLAALYGERYRVTLNTAPAGGTRAALTVPYHTAAMTAADRASA